MRSALYQRQREFTMTRNPPRENLGKIWFDAVGGATLRYRPERPRMFTARRCFWFNINPAGAQRRRRTWLRGFYAAMAQWNQGAYVNYADPDLEDYLHDHFGANLEGLSAVKRAYDPHNFFRFPQSIPPA